MKQNHKILCAIAILIIEGIFSGFSNAQTRYLDLALSEDNVYVASSDGLFVHNKQTGEESNLNKNLDGWVSAVGVSPDGKVYVGCNVNNALYTLEGDTFQRVNTEGNRISNIAAIAFGNGLWVGGEVNLLHHSGESWRAYSYPLPSSSHCAFDAFAYDSEQDIMWFGIDSCIGTKQFGYVLPNGEANFIDIVSGENNDWGVVDVYDLHLLKSDCLLLATNYGLMKYESGQFSIVDPLKLTETANSVSVSALCGNGESYWCAKNKTVRKYSEGQVYEYTIETENPNDRVIAMECDGDNLWIVMYMSGLFKIEDSSFKVVAGTYDIGISDSDIVTDNCLYDIHGNLITKPSKGQLYIHRGKKRIGL